MSQPAPPPPPSITGPLHELGAACQAWLPTTMPHVVKGQPLPTPVLEPESTVQAVNVCSAVLHPHATDTLFLWLGILGLVGAAAIFALSGLIIARAGERLWRLIRHRRASLQF
ncbi:hypothetical protein [Acetobacter nitrogenifigens]|uniref:Uncharacterized protein n=2 Tax=Acetobacter nitrogenifigens TaxID=285268 RepID=A0A511XFE1_9PROT|nr:hypothetical protein [Acetobacter nitrogenifigens]GEN61676.1 hypothetical protein ANI02nite_35600 [Acetobacter nitrogenifigens DSM 23921 = NBRC 105050]